MMPDQSTKGRRWSDSDPRIARIARTRAKVLKIAGEMFLQEGFAAVSMDRIAAQTGVSKMTLYRQFGDKNTLFIETISGTWTEIVPQFDPARDVDEARKHLAVFGRVFIEGVLSPQVLRLNQIMMGEASRINELGALFYKLSVEPAISAVELILSGIFSGEELSMRAVAFLQIVSGNYQRVLFDIEPANTKLFEAQLDLAIRLILADV